MECCHIEDHMECEVLSSKHQSCRCDLCQSMGYRLYEMEREHIRELMKKYKELLAQLDLEKLLDK